MQANQYFGIPLVNIEAARSHQTKGRHRFNTRVPSRREVATLAPQELGRILLAWMNHSTTEIIPSRAQIHEVLEVLKTRQDYRDITAIVEMCANYISGD